MTPVDDTGAVPRSSAFVGRRAELARVLQAVDDAVTSSRARLVVVAGEAGVGKTRLLDEVVASSSDVTVVRTRADELDAAAFGLWLPALARLDLPLPGSDSQVPPGEQRWELVDLLAGALVAMAPVLVVADDLHWADDHGLWVLEQLLDRCCDQSIAVVATTRPAPEARAARWHRTARRADLVDLHGLVAEEVAELAGLLGSQAVDAVALQARTGGNPLFVREQLRAPEASLPASIEVLLGDVIARLGADVAAVVSALALAGPSIPAEVLATAGGWEATELGRHLEAILRSEVLVAGDLGLRFRHDLLAEAAVARLAPIERQRWHHGLADAWRASGDAYHSAMHRLLAVPVVDPSVAAEEALEAAGALRDSGRTAEAAELMGAARSALVSRADVDASVRGRIALAEAEACWLLDDVERATAAGDVAVELAEIAGDAPLAAAAAVSAATHHNPFIPDAVRSEHLAVLDERVPPEHDSVDPGLRIRLRGRRSVCLMSFSDRTAEAVALGDDAVRRARALGDADLLVGALRDRFFVVTTPQDHDARETAAAEILVLARTHRRPALALLAHEWSYVSRMGTGDLSGAIAALEELEALAAIMPSPLWRYAGAVRRSGALAILGDFEGCVSLAGSSSRAAVGVVPPLEAMGLEVGLRVTAGDLYGRDDHGADELQRKMLRATGDVPVLFLQACHALADLVVLHDGASAKRRLTPWLGRFDVALRGAEGLPVLGSVASVVCRTGWCEAAAGLRAVLRPFAGRMPVGNGVCADVSVDHHLGALALLDGDLEEAMGWATAAVAMARRMRAPVLEARALALLADVVEQTGDAAAATSARDAALALADPLGMRLRGAASRRAPARTLAGAAPGPRVVRVRLDAGRWFLESPHGSAHVADSTGMRQLVHLVRTPGTEVAAVDLAGFAGSGPTVVSSDLGASLDTRAKREYRRRIGELHQEIEEAEDHNDPERALKHRVELDAILDELRAAVGLGGRDRPQGSSSERARVNVARTLRRAIAGLGRVLPELGAHLDVSVRTGHRCAYAPEPAAALTWELLT